MNVTRAILEDKKYDSGTKIYYGTKMEFNKGFALSINVRILPISARAILFMHVVYT